MTWRRWRPVRSSGTGPSLVVVSTMAMGAGLLPTQVFSVLGPTLVDDFGLDPSDLGIIAATAFAAAGLSSLGAGPAVQWLSLRSSLIALFGAAGAGLVIAGLATHYAALLVAAALAGLAQAISNPATNLAVASVARPDRRGVMIGLKQSGVQVAQFLVGLLAPPLASVGGRVLATGALVAYPVVGLALSGLTMPAGAGRRSEPPGAAATPRRSGLDPCVPVLAAFMFLTSAALQSTNVYFPLFAHQRLGVSQAVAGVGMAVAAALGVASRVTWGRARHRADRDRRDLVVLALVSAAGGGLVTVASVLGSPVVAGLGLVLHGIATLAVNVVVVRCLVDRIEVGRVARASAHVSLGMYAGFMSGPLLFGLIIDSGLGYGGAWTAMTLFYVLSVGLMVTAHDALSERPFDRGTTDA